MKKVLSVILACTLAFSVFCMSSSAADSATEEVKEELLSQYELCVDATAKIGLVKTKVISDSYKKADYSTLSDADKTLTELRDADTYTSFGEKKEYIEYFDSSNKTEFKDISYEFSAKSYIKSFFLDVDDAAMSSDGCLDLYVFDCSDSYNNELWEFNAYTNALTHVLDSFTLKKTLKTSEKSALGKTYTVTEYSEITYAFEYQLVSPESLELSMDDIVLTYKDTTEIQVKISPDNATFKDFYYVVAYADGDLSSDMIVYETGSSGEGTIKITAVGKGVTELRVYTVDGKFCDTCKITVEFDFFDYFRFFFDKMVENMKRLLER